MAKQRHDLRSFTSTVIVPERHNLLNIQINTSNLDGFKVSNQQASQNFEPVKLDVKKRETIDNSSTSKN